MLKRLLTSLFLLTLTSSAVAERDAPGPLLLLVSKFEGDRNLGQNVATVMSLSVWRTLRRPPADLPGAVQSAIVIWPEVSDSPVGTPDRAAAEAAELVLWGAASKYGDGVVVDAYLSIPANRQPYNSDWTVRVGDASVTLDLPRHIYHLGAEILPASLVAYYRSPSALGVCQIRVVGCHGPAVGSGMTARQHEGEWSQVALDSGVTGWIHQPGLARVSGAAGPFTGGLVAYYRGQFDYAASQWRRTAAISSAPPELRRDATDLASAAALRARAALPERCNTNSVPSSEFGARVRVMGWLNEATRASIEARQGAVNAAIHCLEKAELLMEPDDSWLNEARAVIRAASR